MYSIDLQPVHIPEEAKTTLEWADELGYGIKKTQHYIRKQIKQGTMESMRIPIIDIAGRKNYSYVYLYKS